jgi:hypothetical protein
LQDNGLLDLARTRRLKYRRKLKLQRYRPARPGVDSGQADFGTHHFETVVVTEMETAALALMNNLERILIRVEDICCVVPGVVFHP